MKFSWKFENYEYTKYYLLKDTFIKFLQFKIMIQGLCTPEDTYNNLN